MVPKIIQHTSTHTGENRSVGGNECMIESSNGSSRRERPRGEVAKLRDELATKTAELERVSELNRALSEKNEGGKGFDPLTGLLRREQFEDELRSALATPAGKHNQSLPGRMSVLFVDIDHFKDVNDKFRHERGDAVLRAVARVLREGIRGGDMVGRWGGEELVVALRGATEAMAAEIAEELRQKIEQLRFSEDKLRVTASFGVATTDTVHPRALEDLMKSADKAMYFSKQNGRNRVTTESGRETEMSRQGELDV